MIRQTISCDVCKSEKKQSNYWFVAFEQSAELRLAGWNSRYRTRPGAKHLCGQACVYRLLDDFMARLIAIKPQLEPEKKGPMRVSATDASLTSNAAYIEVESARLVTMPAKTDDAERPTVVDEAPRYGSRNWRAEVWEQELEREREIEERADLMVRHGL